MELHDLDLVCDDLGELHFFSIPLTTTFRRVTVREGVFFQGPMGWGEFCAFTEYNDQESLPWLRTSLEAAFIGWPPPQRTHIPVNSIIPAVNPAEAHHRAVTDGSSTAKIKVADHPESLGEDIARVEAVRDALGPSGNIRIDVNGQWDVDTALRHLPLIDKAAQGLQYVEQPCATIEELATVRRRINIPLCADESIRRAEDPLRIAIAGAADIAMLKCTPLGGVRRSLEIAHSCGLPVVVSSAVETSIGMSAQVALAAQFSDLPYACGFGTSSLLSGDVLPDDSALRPYQGSLSVPTGPVSPDPRLLQQWAMTDLTRREWWVARLNRVLALQKSSP